MIWHGSHVVIQHGKGTHISNRGNHVPHDGQQFYQHLTTFDWGDGQSTAGRGQMGRLKTAGTLRWRWVAALAADFRTGDVMNFLFAVINNSWGSRGWYAKRSNRCIVLRMLQYVAVQEHRIMIPVDECMWYRLPHIATTSDPRSGAPVD